MAEDQQYSEQTKAIIERLKAEGQRTRNDGTNSIKQVIKRLEELQKESKLGRHGETHSLKAIGIEIQKFSSLFKTISASTVQQTKMLRSSLKISEEQLETQKREKELSGSDQEIGELENTYKKLKLQNDIENEKEIAERRNQNKGIFALFKNFGGIVKKGLWWAGGLFVAFNLLKGAIDELTDGGFTRFQNEATEAFKTFAEYLKDPDVLQTLKILGAIAAPAAILAKVLPAIVNALQTAAIFSLLRRRTAGPADIGDVVVAGGDNRSRAERRREWRGSWENFKKGGKVSGATVAAAEAAAVAEMQKASPAGTQGGLVRSAIATRGLLAAATGASLIGLGNLTSGILKEETENMTADELAQLPVTQSISGSEVLGNVSGFATAGAMIGGVKGLIVGAILGGVYSVGQAAYRKIKDEFEDMDEVSNETQRILQDIAMRKRAGLDQGPNAQLSVVAKAKVQTRIDKLNKELEALQAEQAAAIRKKDQTVQDIAGITGTDIASLRSQEGMIKSLEVQESVIAGRDERIQTLMRESEILQKQLGNAEKAVASVANTVAAAVTAQLPQQSEEKKKRELTLEEELANFVTESAKGPIVINNNPVVAPQTNVNSTGPSILNTSNIATLMGGGGSGGLGGMLYDTPGYIN